jgi:hypothetical protein
VSRHELARVVVAIITIAILLFGGRGTGQEPAPKR